VTARKIFGSFFGIGYLPGMAGTYASAVTAALMAAAWYLGCPAWGVVAAAVIVTAGSVAVGRDAEKDFGSKDPRPFVLDEVAGMLISGLAAWMPCSRWPWATLAIAFFWFRVTDILKPPPARQLERLPRGWGITMDDVAAGLMALVLAIGSDVVLVRLVG